MLSQVITGYLYKYSHLTLFKMGLFILVVVSLFFTYQNIQVINALHTGAANSVNIDPNVIETPYRTVRDAILSSPYQATVLFLPILSALILATDYQFGEDDFSSLICANWKIRLFSQIFSIVVISIMTTFTLFLLNALLLKFMLVSKLQSILSIGLILDVFTRIGAFTITLNLLSLLLVKITKRSIPSLIVIVLLLVFSLSGILRAISPILDNLLPLIGARSFAFGRIEAGQTTQLYGAILLLFETFLTTICLFYLEKIKWGKKNEKPIA